jgi:hypothetical protein
MPEIESPFRRKLPASLIPVQLRVSGKNEAGFFFGGRINVVFVEYPHGIAASRNPR